MQLLKNIFRCRLNANQVRAYKLANEGHNVCILGEAGTGKSFVVNLIKKQLERQGVTCNIVCSSGIACEVYEVGHAVTVYSHYGLQKAELPHPGLLERVLSRNDVVARI